MKALDAIPQALKGRGQLSSVPIECATCGEVFLFPASAGRGVTCPTCKTKYTFADDDATFVSHNGQAV